MNNVPDVLHSVSRLDYANLNTNVARKIMNWRYNYEQGKWLNSNGGETGYGNEIPFQPCLMATDAMLAFDAFMRAHDCTVIIQSATEEPTSWAVKFAKGKTSVEFTASLLNVALCRAMLAMCGFWKHYHE